MSTIKQDLESILFKTEETGEVNIMDIVNGRPGLNQESGLYRVDGGLVIDKVQSRSGTGTNIVKTVGLKVTKIEHIDGGYRELESLYVTKEEALDLAIEYGAINAYVKTTYSKAKRGKQAERTHHLQPYPSRAESFTSDESLVFVYEVDATGSKVRPVNLLIKEDDCSSMMWDFIRLDFENRKARDAKKFKGKSTENVQQVTQLRGDIKNRRLGVIKNPFAKK